MEIRHPPPGPGSDEGRRRIDNATHGGAGPGLSVQLLRFDPGAKPTADRDMELRDAIQHIALEWPCYGRPRITAELRRQGWTVNPKRVYRLMREDNLLCVRRRNF